MLGKHRHHYRITSDFSEIAIKVLFKFKGNLIIQQSIVNGIFRERMKMRFEFFRKSVHSEILAVFLKGFLQRPSIFFSLNSPIACSNQSSTSSNSHPVQCYRCNGSLRKKGRLGFQGILSPAMLSGEFRVLRSVAQSKSSVDIYFEGSIREGCDK